MKAQATSFTISPVLKTGSWPITYIDRCDLKVMSRIWLRISCKYIVQMYYDVFNSRVGLNLCHAPNPVFLDSAGLGQNVVSIMGKRG